MIRKGRKLASAMTCAILILPLALSFALVGGCPVLSVDNANDNSASTNSNSSVNDNANENSANSNANTNTNSSADDVKGNTGLTGKFVGSARCSICHNNIHTDWLQTLHSRAYESLEAIGESKNAACVVCHTVGAGEPGGWVDRATTNDLAGVGCESCHGPGGDHASNVNDESLRPVISLSSNVCGKCHAGEHQPNFDDWQTSRHAKSIEPSHATAWAAGTAGNLTNCGKCHSGDFFFHSIIKGEAIGDDYLKGKTADQMTPITCAICHNPHAKTFNASTPDDGRDYQLRFPQIKYTTPTASLAAAQDRTRFNLCGQCHHTRERVWTDGSREPHPSDQVNVFFGELPVPDSKPDPIVPFRASVHLNAPEQCSTCHVFRSPATASSPTVSGHTFEVNFDACASCHGTREIGEAKLAALEAELAQRLTEIERVLSTWALANVIDNKGSLSWEYTSEGGPTTAGQAKIPDNIKKARYIYYYVSSGGGNGVHNPDFVRDALVHALEYAETAPPRLP